MGAGDAFNAGYISYCLLEKQIDEALRFAVHCGRAVAISPGDTAGFPRNHKVTV
jgi:sugar/nucleoside kinase (ribokinase family)